MRVFPVVFYIAVSRAAFYRAQQELIERQKLEDAEAKEKRSKFSEDVRAQIREKERQRISERKKYFEEGVKLDEEARQRQLKLEEVKRRKLEELRYERLFFFIAVLIDYGRPM